VKIKLKNPPFIPNVLCFGDKFCNQIRVITLVEKIIYDISIYIKAKWILFVRMRQINTEITEFSDMQVCAKVLYGNPVGR
jgi:hypothetical protein